MKVREYLPSAPSGNYVIFGYTPLCGTCKVAERMIDIMPELIEVNIMKVDLNFAASFAQRYQLMSVPVLLIVKDDEVVETIYRFESVTNIYEIIRKVLTI
ncbi:thioredoxin family protein [Macrococcus bovicus]|uniref:thioredoxin family protein n=1 Tax=Macrococcus bovicus TaxID=69968 RepID=UPI0025A577AE|nr:thioredoxin family protein [Macrococcus bovicus]WJP98350.1 thioredoxin family protein [Macrococcus bovicus]